jgi:regulator of replication initiation timing
VILSRNVARLRAQVEALDADFTALIADQRAARAELSYLRDRLAVQLSRDVDELRVAGEATARTLDARTEQQV